MSDASSAARADGFLSAWPIRLSKQLLKRADHLSMRVSAWTHPGRRRAVLFDVCNRIGLDAQAPVLAELVRRGQVDVAATSGSLAPARLAELLHAAGVEGVPLVPPLWARHAHYDVTVITESPSIPFWRATRMAFLHHGSCFGNDAMPYAFHFIRGAECYLLSLSPNEVRLCAAMFGEAASRRLIVTGQPKLDALVNGAYDRCAVLAGYGLDADRPTVLVTSHWRPTSLVRSGDLGPLRDDLAARDVNVLVTAHDHLFDATSRHFSGGTDWAAALGALFDGPRMRLVVRPADHRPLLAAADVMIGDHSSIHLEYAPLGRPMVLYHDPAQLFSDATMVALLEATADVVHDTAAIPGRLDRALGGTGVDQAARRRLVDHALAHVGSATVRAAAAIEGLAVWGGRAAPVGCRTSHV